MRSARFAVGVLAGVLLAAVVIAASTLAAPPATYFPTAQFVTTGPSPTTVTATFTASSTTSQSLTGGIVTFSTPSENSSVSAPLAVSGISSLRSSASSLTPPPPSSVARIVAQPLQSLVLLIPVLAALLLGLATYRGSSPKNLD